MSLQNINPTETPAWKKLTDHYTENKETHLKALFSGNTNRADKFSLKWNDFLVDFSKT